jgi:arsenate reductase
MDRDGLLLMCVANSARSQMAEGFARRILGPDAPIWSAGSEPSRVNPYAIRAMAEVGIDISGHTSDGVDAVPTERIARVITLCADEVCPLFPGDVERLHLPFPDPGAGETDAEILQSFRDVRDAIEAKLTELLA